MVSSSLDWSWTLCKSKTNLSSWDSSLSFPREERQGCQLMFRREVTVLQASTTYPAAMRFSYPRDAARQWWGAVSKLTWKPSTECSRHCPAETDHVGKGVKISPSHFRMTGFCLSSITVILLLFSPLDFYTNGIIRPLHQLRRSWVLALSTSPIRMHSAPLGLQVSNNSIAL